MAEEFEYWQSKKDGQWYFHLVGLNGEIIAQSEGYTTKDNCLNGIDAVKRYASIAKIIEK